jgi:hypothetical protein
MLIEWTAMATAPLIIWIAIAIAPPIVLMLAEGTSRLVEDHDLDVQDVPPVPGPAPVSAAPVFDGLARAPRGPVLMTTRAPRGPVLMTTRAPGGPLGLRRDRTPGRDIATRRPD